MKNYAHIPEGQLKAYLDQELSPPEQERVRAHLGSCAACQGQLELLSARAERLDGYLSRLAPGREHAQRRMGAAYARLEARSKEKENTNMLHKIFPRRYRPAWAIAGVVLILAIALVAFPSARAIANSFLGLFRVQQFTIVQVNPGDLPEQLGSSSQLEQLLSQNVEVEKLGERQTAASAAEASQLAGIPVRLPTGLEGLSSLRVQPGAKATFAVDAQHIQAVLNEIRRPDIQVPASLDGATVTMEMPNAVAALYGSCEQALETARGELQAQGYDPEEHATPRLDGCTSLVQMPSPTISAPPGLDIAQIGEAYLQVMGMSAEEAAQFAATVDWTTTLVIPIPRYGTDYQGVMVDGVEGTLIRQELENHDEQYLLLWVKEGILYALTGAGDGSNAVEIANSLQ